MRRRYSRPSTRNRGFEVADQRGACGEPRLSPVRIRQPSPEIGVAPNVDEAAHSEMAETAQLRTGDLVLEVGLTELLAHLVGRHRWRKPHRDVHARNRVL